MLIPRHPACSHIGPSVQTTRRPAPRRQGVTSGRAHVLCRTLVSAFPKASKATTTWLALGVEKFPSAAQPKPKTGRPGFPSFHTPGPWSWPAACSSIATPPAVHAAGCPSDRTSGQRVFRHCLPGLRLESSASASASACARVFPSSQQRREPSTRLHKRAPRVRTQTRTHA